MEVNGNCARMKYSIVVFESVLDEKGYFFRLASRIGVRADLIPSSLALPSFVRTGYRLLLVTYATLEPKLPV